MPFALVGLISSLALWDLVKFSSDRLGLDQKPVLQQCLIRIAQCGESFPPLKFMGSFFFFFLHYNR